MSIESVSSMATGSSLAIDSTVSQTALPRQKSSEALPKIEFETVVKAGSDELQKAVDAANDIFIHVRPDIKFVIDEGTNDVVIMLVEPETGDVINRYPTEQAIAISNAIVESQARVADQRLVFQSVNESFLGLFVQQKT
jgi:flagellar protein FlaG